MSDLKLVAMDADDLQILSAHLQDAFVRIADMAYLPQQKRFAALTSRFDWTTSANGAEGTDAARKTCAIRFERVLSAQLQQIDLTDGRKLLQLMALAFEPASEPSGYVRLLFAGGSQIRLHVECIEAELSDFGQVTPA